MSEMHFLYSLQSLYPIRNEFPFLNPDGLDIRQGERMRCLIGRPYQVAQKPKVGCFVDLKNQFHKQIVCISYPTIMMSWNPSPVWAAVSIPFLACLSVQVVLQPRMARNLEEMDLTKMFPNLASYILSIDLFGLWLLTRWIEAIAFMTRVITVWSFIFFTIKLYNWKGKNDEVFLY